MNAQAPITRTARACGLLLTAALAVPALATAAPTLKADLPCYSPGQPIGLGGAGYTPAGDVGLLFAALRRARQQHRPAEGSAEGRRRGRHRAPGCPRRTLASDNDLRENVTLTANDQARMGPNGPSGRPRRASRRRSFMLSAVDVLVSPWLSGSVNPRALTTFKVVGWAPYRRVYAHYFLNGKRVKTVAIGAVSGPCGDMTKKVRQFPFRPVPAGRYRIRFTGTPFYDPQGFWIGYREVVVAKAKAVR